MGRPNLDLSGLNQTFPNIFKRSDQESVQLNRSFGIVLTKYREYGSHVVVVPELHLGEFNASGYSHRWTTILNIVHLSCVFMVGLKINLVCLILQDR